MSSEDEIRAFLGDRFAQCIREHAGQGSRADDSFKWAMPYVDDCMPFLKTIISRPAVVKETGKEGITDLTEKNLHKMWFNMNKEMDSSVAGFIKAVSKTFTPSPLKPLTVPEVSHAALEYLINNPDHSEVTLEFTSKQLHGFVSSFGTKPITEDQILEGISKWDYIGALTDIGKKSLAKSILEVMK